MALQLGGRTGSVEGKADRSEPVLPLHSVLTAEASLYSLFIPDLAARGECRPWPRPPPPSPKRLDHLSERLRESACARFSGDFFAERERADRAPSENFTHVVRSSAPLVGCRVLKVPYRARFVCCSEAALRNEFSPKKCCDHYKRNI